MIKPILTYASDFWGCLKFPQNNPIETFQMKVLKQILGVHKQTTNLGVLLEVGRTTLDLECIKLGIKNWERIRKNNANSLLIASYNDSKIEQLPWILGVKGILEKNGLLSLFINEYSHGPVFIYKKLFKTLVDQFHQNALASIGSEGSKLRTYALIKTNIGMEKYLNEIKHVTMRIQMTKFRISNHNLMIEVGRYQGVKADLRFCPFCQNHVESEIHFLIECPTYEHIRILVFNKIASKNPFFKYLSKEDKFLFLLTCENNYQIASFILKCFELRNFLSVKPKSTD